MERVRGVGVNNEEVWKRKEENVCTLEVKKKVYYRKSKQHLCCGQHKGQRNINVVMAMINENEAGYMVESGAGAH